MKMRRATGAIDTTTHGQARTSEYRIWQGMRARCENETKNHFDRYGGRGIAVHATWLGPGGFERFVAYVGKRPTPRHTIDRIDNERGYEPGNVRWATRKEQSRNTSTNVRITVNGETLSAAEWIERNALPRHAIYGRLKKGWDPVQAITVPVGKRGARVGHAWVERKRTRKTKVAA